MDEYNVVIDINIPTDVLTSMIYAVFKGFNSNTYNDLNYIRAFNLISLFERYARKKLGCDMCVLHKKLRYVHKITAQSIKFNTRKLTTVEVINSDNILINTPFLEHIEKPEAILFTNTGLRDESFYINLINFLDSKNIDFIDHITIDVFKKIRNRIYMLGLSRLSDNTTQEYIYCVGFINDIIYKYHDCEFTDELIEICANEAIEKLICKN